MHLETSSSTVVTEHQSNTLWSRSFIGLLISQFLAAFNDQAIHASAMFFAINTNNLTESQAISLMPILFYAPWAIFCTVAGFLADRYSKKYSLVFWKFAEIVITGIALFGFWLGTRSGTEIVGSWIVLSTVFLMGMHSAFFVPAKYGVMPEILQPHLLSKGNGILESLSFLAVILGTVCGGVLSFLFLREETIIGIILVGLAIIGALASLLIRTMPAANPNMRFPPYIYGPLIKNLKAILSSKPLIFAVLGIAFFTFVVAFMRATVYMLGESQNPRWNELRTSAIVGTVALGIGMGSPLAGWLSGRKIELGLIPIGAMGMMLGCGIAALNLDHVLTLVICIVLIGFSTGFYLVPLFTLLQYRAPKTSKGDMIATSNFVNITGAISASILFFLIVMGAKKVGFLPEIQPQDKYAQGQLVRLEFDMGRPVYFEIQPKEGDQPIKVGQIPNPEQQGSKEIWKHLFDSGTKQGKSTVIEIERGLESPSGDDQGPSVIVSRYEVGDVEHFDIRREDKPLLMKYDQRNLPQLLFFGAGFMTLGMLILLIFRLPDLPRRGSWLIQNWFGRKVHITGLSRLPGVGPLILITNASEMRYHRFIVSAVDRNIRFLEGNLIHLDMATSWLTQGNVLGLSLHHPEVESFLTKLIDRVPTEVLPVACGIHETVIHVGFAEGIKDSLTLSQIHESIQSAIKEK